MGVSSPMEPMGSCAVSTMGFRMSSSSSLAYPNAFLTRTRCSAAACSAGGTGVSPAAFSASSGCMTPMSVL